jgi:cytochrome c2
MSKLTKDQELNELLRLSRLKVAAMSPEECAAMVEAQRQSFARAMAPCEHGVADFEDCAQCRTAARSALSEQPEVKE